MSLIMTAFVFSGFGLTYLAPMAKSSLAPLPPVVHVHGLFYFSWMLLLVVQALLICTHKLAYHRSFGTFGIFLGTAMLALGSLLTVLFTDLRGKPPIPGHYDLAYLSVVAMLSFGLLFCLAIRNVRNPENHKRLMLFATIVLLPPGINRLYMVSFGLTELPLLATYFTMNALALAVVVFDWRTTSKVQHATWIGLVVLLLAQILHPIIAHSAAFADFCGWLGSAARYR
jgi:hypothetical protein